MLRLLLNSKIFFAQMSHRPDLMAVLTRLLMSKSPFIGVLASMALQGMTSLFSAKEDKIETLNRRILINGTVEMEESHISSVASHEHSRIFDAIRGYILYFEEQATVKSLHLFGVSTVLRTLLEGHTTAKEDLQQFAEMVVESDHNSDEMKENKLMV
jgi:hypothetical protein